MATRYFVQGAALRHWYLNGDNTIVLAADHEREVAEVERKLAVVQAENVKLWGWLNETGQHKKMEEPMSKRRAEAEGGVMAWTTTKPTTPGFYWYKDTCGNEEVVRISQGLVFLVFSGSYSPIEKFKGQWSSCPVPRPEEAP